MFMVLDFVTELLKIAINFSPSLDIGARRDRTADLLRAKQTLSQLSYGPKKPINGGSGWT